MNDSPLRPEIPAGVGELLDRLAILLIKSARIRDQDRRQNVEKELHALEARLAALPQDPLRSLSPQAWELLVTNACLWEVEENLRDAERQRRFDARFIFLARSVYHLNDRRAAIKRTINLASGSALIEEKSYGCGGSEEPRPTT